VAAIAIAVSVLAHSPWLVLASWTAAGAGYSSIIPLVFAAGGRIRGLSEGLGVATVTGLGYLGFLAGPPAIGLISQAASLRLGMSLLIVLALAAAGFVDSVTRRSPELWELN
jgi:MFS family permease